MSHNAATNQMSFPLTICISPKMSQTQSSPKWPCWISARPMTHILTLDDNIEKHTRALSNGRREGHGLSSRRLSITRQQSTGQPGMRVHAQQCVYGNEMLAGGILRSSPL